MSVVWSGSYQREPSLTAWLTVVVGRARRSPRTVRQPRGRARGELSALRRCSPPPSHVQVVRPPYDWAADVMTEFVQGAGRYRTRAHNPGQAGSTPVPCHQIAGRLSGVPADASSPTGVLPAGSSPGAPAASAAAPTRHTSRTDVGTRSPT